MTDATANTVTSGTIDYDKAISDIEFSMRTAASDDPTDRYLRQKAYADKIDRFYEVDLSSVTDGGFVSKDGIFQFDARGSYIEVRIPITLLDNELFELYADSSDDCPSTTYVCVSTNIPLEDIDDPDDRYPAIDLTVFEVLLKLQDLLKSHKQAQADNEKALRMFLAQIADVQMAAASLLNESVDSLPSDK